MGWVAMWSPLSIKAHCPGSTLQSEPMRVPQLQLQWCEPEDRWVEPPVILLFSKTYHPFYRPIEAKPAPKRRGRKKKRPIPYLVPHTSNDNDSRLPSGVTSVLPPNPLFRESRLSLVKFCHFLITVLTNFHRGTVQCKLYTPSCNHFCYCFCRPKPHNRHWLHFFCCSSPSHQAQGRRERGWWVRAEGSHGSGRPRVRRIVERGPRKHLLHSAHCIILLTQSPTGASAGGGGTRCGEEDVAGDMEGSGPRLKEPGPSYCKPILYSSIWRRNAANDA